MNFVLSETAKAASELVQRHGLDVAKDIIHQRASRLERQGSWPEYDLALLLLNALEDMPEKKAG
ncbi:hypothetical protein [Telmatospirillum siberiense]|uniref:Uncharacterized protein n=1 Tax=Telmatospirillum siberiense TaxID=382514 RepID=A0A2N3PTW0_9PROT|nr:hypothetical protein [Telmatospirillum siberiense]PKU23845.1 hypothetical protein CWS72_14285 [Telmatospirillum siberiense]